MNFGLKKRDIDHLFNAFERFPEIELVLVFGSRAKGNSTAGSDIDLALKGQDLTDETISQLRAMLDELPLPYFFDIVDYAAVQNNDLREHIDRIGEVLYQRKQSTFL